MLHLPLFASGAVNVDLDATMLAQFILFTAFVVLMKDLIFDPLLRVFDERERRTAGAIDQARKLDEQAIALKGEYDSRLDEVRREAAVDREQIRGKLKRLEGEMLGSARTAVSERLGDGMGRIEQQTVAIRGELEAERAALAAQIASRVLGREVRP